MTTNITKITMQGFKSFNKRVSIPLLKGFNIFCGPNGVGKSNVIDAVCFVLGRISAKTLRADRLHELIFHGGNGRSPAQYAAVSLFLDNCQKQFSFEEPEVSVTRKVNKKGVSVYKIQGRTTTREKVLELLSSTHIRPGGHNIVLQGDITNIIEMNPIERRYIIDEISGIAEYNEKKDKAKKDLDVVDQKLKEAEIVITERYDIFKKLEDDRNAALRYQQLQKELLLMKSSLAHSKMREYEEELHKIEKDIEKNMSENKNLEKDIENIENELEGKEKRIQELAKHALEISKQVEAEREISFLRTKIMMDKDKISSNQSEIGRLNNIIRSLKDIESQIGIGVPRAVRTILEQRMEGVYGTVGNLFKTNEKYGIAIEVTAGSQINDIIVENEDVAKFCIDYLKREKIGRATFLPLNKIKSKNVPVDLLGKKGVIGLASKLIKFDSRYKPAMDFVFGSTLIIDNLDTAKNIGIGKARMVSLEGDLVERSGAMIGGYYVKHPQFAKETAGKEISEYERMKKSLEEEIENLKKEIEEFENKLKEYGQTEETKRIIDLEKLKIDSQADIDEMRNKRKILYEKRLAVQSEINRLNILKAKLDAELENVKIEIQQYGDIKPIEKAISTLQKKVRDIERELLLLGPVNFKAIEQYEKFKSEFDHYKEKYEKILEEKKAVMEMIDKIEEKRREVFYRCLKKVSENFDRIFQIMTNGSARVELENPLELESGLIIEANPAGKMLLNIDSMSGGEKTLTALAFLFAVQQYQPAPFYILDEVDAALDKENSKKVAELIKKLSMENQFIVITHNDTTIKYGDCIYGVTMDRGESKILGIELPGE